MKRLSRTRMIGTTFLAFLAQVAPLPFFLAVIRPAFAVVAVIFWSLAAPQLGGIALGFITGLALDVYRGVVLGQHALATALVAYFAIRQHLIIRNKSAFEQAIFCAALILLWELTVWLIEGLTGQTSGHWTRWLPIISSALLWPLLANQLVFETRARR
ncbi:MAG: rod shape-determining protein MreD [Steroidobacteraceae bacterium]